ncbi:hypothetical protein OHA74_14555 [Streptomyces phaeochromogenes]|uniref:hypothetical protein n=1 Tax=Streptomyces phaeochromogenes TaxID=1923 RepID=UPI002E2D489A|nr:hypothetical protein [Streptomyces phaeochromogenes]
MSARPEPFGRAASRLIGAMAPPGVIRLGKVTARVPVVAPDASPQQRYAERRVLTAHAASPGELHPVDDDAACLEWHPYTQVAALVAHLATPDLDVFLRGYVDGWIPDGWITLG